VNPELDIYLEQIRYIRQDVAAIVANLGEDEFLWRPAPDRWSIGECFEHLNLTAAAFLPAIDAAIEDARGRNLRGHGPFAYPMLERLFVASNEPPPRRRFRAFKGYRPARRLSRGTVMTAFSGWQDLLAERIEAADGLDLRRARRRSPIVPLVKWSLGTMFAVVLAHERRHIWQARQVRNDRRFPEVEGLRT
jgi:DinB family protein